MLSRPSKRGLDNIQDDMIKMGVKRRSAKAMDRGEWRRICEGARVLQELKSHGESILLLLLLLLLLLFHITWKLSKSPQSKFRECSKHRMNGEMRKNCFCC
jgi:hypothetical protein